MQLTSRKQKTKNFKEKKNYLQRKLIQSYYVSQVPICIVSMSQCCIYWAKLHTSELLIKPKFSLVTQFMFDLCEQKQLLKMCAFYKNFY